MSACIAERLLIVSSSDSPLLVDEALMFRLMTSADRRFDAISKVVRVRVEFSKNRLNTLLPRISGTFLTSRSLMPTNDDAVSRMCVTTDVGSPSIVSRCCSSPFLFSWGLSIVMHRQSESAIIGALKFQRFAGGQGDCVGDKIGGNRQFTTAAIDQRRQHDFGRTTVVE